MRLNFFNYKNTRTMNIEKSFCEGRKSVKVEPLSGRTLSSTSDEKIDKNQCRTEVVEVIQFMTDNVM